jgi:hypothetical protein
MFCGQGDIMHNQTTLNFTITYAEEATVVEVTVGISQNQDKRQRMLTLEEILKRRNIRHDTKEDGATIQVHSEEEVEKILECFRIFEKQDKIKETRLYVNKKMATELEKKLKSIFPPPEAEIQVKHLQFGAV